MKRLLPLLYLLVLPFTVSSQTVSDTLAYDSAVRPFVSFAQRMETLLSDDLFERTQVGIYIYDLDADTTVFTHAERQTMRPASCQKLITAITALDLLGTNYNFKTELYLLKGEDDHTEVTIRGGYDPLFDQEDMAAFVKALKKHDINRISSPVRLDLSLKDSERLGWGWCWDDHPVPLTPLLYKNKDNFTTRLREALEKEGIEWDGQTISAPVRPDDRHLLTRSHSIDQVLLPMMKDSENSFAEAMFYQIAASEGKSAASRKDAARAVNRLIEKVGLSPVRYQIADGSGLSLYNYASPELLGLLLRYAWQKKSIRRHLLPALPVAGIDGTLHRRMKSTRAEGNVKAKTGTVEGVSTLAGYLTTAAGNTLCFVIMNQGIRRTSEGRNFQDRVCRALTE